VVVVRSRGSENDDKKKYGTSSNGAFVKTFARYRERQMQLPIVRAGNAFCWYEYCSGVECA